MFEAHVPAAVAGALRQAGIDAIALGEWRGGRYRTALDSELLEVAGEQAAVIVTYDCRTFPPLLREWAETGQSHAGVVLVDTKTVRSDDIGGLIRALQALVARYGGDDWRDRVAFLERG